MAVWRLFSHRPAAAALSLLGALAGVLHAGGTAASDVPGKYAQLYALLQGQLTPYEAYLDAHQPPSRTQATFATELLAANGNRGEDLLGPNTMNAVRLSLDRFQEIGIQGVTIAVPYPLFDPAFPRHDEYVTFFSSVAQELRSRGMKLDVESSVAFANTPFSSITWDWSAYTVDSLASAKGAMLQVIVSQVRPDYLNLGSEESTQAELTGIQALSDPQTYAHFIALQLQGLDRGSTVVGAGCSAWESLTTASLVAALPELDSFTFHVYPLDATSQSNSIQLAQIAKAHGKRLVLDEAWLYKTQPGQGGVAMSTDVFKRDTYAFFAPLDQQFLRCMAKLSQTDGIEYLSVFWSTEFFAYLTYSDALDAQSYSQVAAQENQAASAAMAADAFSTTGDFMKTLIAEYPAPLSVTFLIEPGNPTDDDTVTLTASANGGTPPYAYAWDFCGASGSGPIVSRKLPAGDCLVTVTVTDASGASASASQQVAVGYSVAVSSVRALSNPFRLAVAGSGFEAGCSVVISGAPAPRTVFKSPAVLVAKGSGLKAMVPKGVMIEVTVRDPDGRESSPFPFVR